ncbi:hypothetical protein M0R45_020192 [Rubus argutus]|uniref:Uncharacterized protein n=1 Tax=Rubus argutus TaxID=59490 RepID=A0AAW1X870_RUBAR
MTQHRFLLVTYPAQGHINPSLQFAKRLISTTGADVTFVTALSALRHISNGSSTPRGLTFAPFSDGYDDGYKPKDDIEHYMFELRRRGSQAVADIIVSSANQGHPYTCVVYTILLPWVAEVARELHVPTAITRTATSNEEPRPSLLHGGFKPYNFALPLMEEQFEILGKESKPTIMVNTFDALEPEALKAIDKYNMIGIGPLMPSAFLDGKDPSDKSFGGDLFQKSKDSAYIEWLNSKPKESVVYVSFGSMSVLSNIQMEEIAKGLLDSRRPFLWVIRENQKNGEARKRN